MSEKKNERKLKRAQKKAELEQKMSKVPVVRRLFHNTGLKIISFVFAVILWGMVMSQTNPPRLKMVYDVPVELTGLETLNNRGLSLATEAEELPDTVDVKLEVPMDDLSRVSAENVSAVLDLSRVMTTGEHEVSVALPTAYGKGTSSRVSSVSVEIESLTTSIVPVQVSTTGALSENLRMGKVVATPAQFQITGPETDVNRVVAAVVEVDLSALTGDLNRSMVYTLVDENYEPVQSVNITSTIGNSVSVSLPVYPIKEVPIAFESSTTGLLKEGFYVEGIEVAPQTVRVAAPQAVLDEIDSIPVSTIDLEGVSESFTTTLPLKKSADIVWTDVNEVDVVVRVKEEEATKTFSGIQVKYRNLAAGYKVEMYNATVDIEVTMAKSKLEKLSNEDIWIYVDLAGMGQTPDTTAPLQVYLKTDALSSVYQLSTEKIVIRIDKAS